MAFGCEYMISKNELESIKEIRKTNLYYAEKEYLQYIFLNALTRMSDSFVFKGGTCLRIAYELERASDDLDFNTSLPIKEVKAIVRKCLHDFTLFGIDFEIYDEKVFKGNYRAEIRFQGPLYTGDKRTSNTIKIDFNARKNLTSETKVIKKLFSDIPPFTLLVMGQKEILAEKMRALIMRQDPKDMYDVWMLLHFVGEKIDLELLKGKLKQDGIDGLNVIFPTKKQYGEQMRLLVNRYPEYEVVVDVINRALGKEKE